MSAMSVYAGRNIDPMRSRAPYRSVCRSNDEQGTYNTSGRGSDMFLAQNFDSADRGTMGSKTALMAASSAPVTPILGATHTRSGLC